MARVTQDRHHIRVVTPLGKDELILTGISGAEYINDLFHFTLDMISPREQIDPTELLGKSVSFCVTDRDSDDHIRWFNGVVGRFGKGHHYQRDHWVYRAEIVPEVWLLKHRLNCRIFQNKTIPDIIQQVLSDAKISNYEMQLGGYDPVEYCVQYMESDLDFITRLIEDEGMLYFFKHEESRHVFKITDTTGGYFVTKNPNLELRSGTGRHNVVDAWQLQGHFLPNKWAHKDYDFESPKKDLNTNTKTVVGYQKAGDFEVFDWPGGYVDKGKGQNRSKKRMEQVESGHKRIDGSSFHRHLSAGGKFTLTRADAPPDENKDWVCSKVVHRAVDEGHFTTTTESFYRNEFSVAQHDTLLRAPRRTQRPVIPGAQTARVVGSGGEGQIYTDKYGRVKVKFHWDRAPETGNDTCWIRCVQPWAGPRFGMSFTPRIGMEVMVLFLDGDPDHPVVAGCIFNGDNMPHFSNDERSVGRETTNRLGITDNRDTKNNSGLFSRSVASKSETDGNVMRFDDQPGSEEMYIHAQKDLTRSVEHDERIEVDNDQKFEIGHDRKGKIGNNDELKVGVNQTIDVGQNIKITAGMKIELIVGASKITIDNTSIKLEAMMIDIKGTGTVNVSAPMTTVKGDGMLTLKGGITLIN
jgi:type VI secretion system secreted protein VgrG